MKMKILFYSLPPKIFCKAMIQNPITKKTNHAQIPIESLHTADENNDSEQINDNLEPGHKKSETESNTKFSTFRMQFFFFLRSLFFSF
jgi:hypothetical protein